VKFLLDQGLSREVGPLLERAGHEAIHVGLIGLHSATDLAILTEARQIGAVVVTHDADFHALLAMSGAATPSVIRLRVEGLDAQAAAALILRIVSACGADLAAGAVVTADRNQARLRRLHWPQTRASLARSG
jgi:predicted nuclease of predicted toxin-antitoxin system